MAKNFKKDAQQLLDMADVNQFQKDIADYSVEALVSLGKIFAKYKLENGEYNSELNDKISIIKETRTYKQKSDDKAVKSISKVIAKVQEESKQESTQAPKNDKAQKPRNSSLSGISIRSSSDTPKNSGVNYNYQRGQGDFFGKSSAFKFIKQMSDNMQSESSNDNQMGFDFDSKVKKTRKASKPTVIKSSITHLDAKALKQIKDILMLPEKMAKKSSVKRSPRRQTKAEKDKATFKRDELNFKNAHLNEQTRKHRSDSRFDRKKFKESTESNNTRNEYQKRTLEFREKVEANKLKRLEINTDLKEKLAQKHIEFSKLNLEKLKIKRQADKDKQDGRLELQKQRKDQTNRNQMERHLHRIHPALGMLYGMNQQRKENSQNNQSGDSGGFMSSMLGSLAGGAGAAGLGMMGRGGGTFRGMKAASGLSAKAMSKHLGMNALKLGGSRLPIIGAGIAGISEGMESGSVGKGLATFAGALTGSALVGAAAGAVFGPVGAIVGAIVGHSLGMIASKEIFDKLSGPSKLGEHTPSGARYNVGQNVNKNVKQVPNPNSPNNPQSASGKIGNAESEFLKFISAGEAEDYNTVYGGGKADLTNMTLAQAAEYQNNSENFANNGASRGIGKYQFTRGPFEEEVRMSGLDPKTTKFSPDIQDKLIMQRLKRMRGYDDFMSGKISKVEFGNKVAEELASLPVLSDFKGKKRGQSRYAGDGLNKSLTDASSYESAIDKLGQSRGNSSIEKAPSKVVSLQDSSNRVQEKSIEEKSKPMNVINVGGSSGGSSSVVNNTYVNPVNTDATPRQLANNMMYPGRLV